MQSFLPARTTAGSTSAIEYGFVAGLVTLACIIALTSLGDSVTAVGAWVVGG